jgi:hypothetical protein
MSDNPKSVEIHNKSMNGNSKSLLICGESGSGKSFSLMNMRDQKGILYINCEGGKPLPFKNGFKQITIEDPQEIFGLLDAIESDETKRYHTVVIDTVSFMMNRYESLHVIGAASTMAGWANYGQFFPKLIYEYIANRRVFVIMLGHLEATLNNETGHTDYKVPVKGALQKNGLEAFFTTVINCRKVGLKDILKDSEEGPLLKITDRDRSLGYMHVFQTRTVKSTVGDRIRSPWALFQDNETYINNDAQVVVDRLMEYYAD